MRWCFLVLAVFQAALFGCGRRETPRASGGPYEDIRRPIRDRMEAVNKHSLNEMSPETADTLTPRLRVEMTQSELNRILAEKNKGADPKTGRNIGTLEFGRAPVWLQDKDGNPLRDDKGEPRADPDKWSCVLYVRDANIEVVFDKDDRVLSWSVEPLPHR
jgi:hypothetical protein